MQKERIVYLDLVRIIAGILVIMVHISAQQIEDLPVSSMAFAITNAFNCLSFSGVALFVMISGVLALRLERETDLKTLLLHRTLHFFVLYYIWKAFYQVITMLEKGENFTLDSIKNDVVLALIQQRGYYHLWFLPMIAILYMAVPLMKKGFAEKKLCQYFLTVFFVVALFVPTLLHYDFKFKYLLVDFFASNDFYLFQGYLGYFVLGHYLHNWCVESTAKKRILLYVAGGFCFLLACVLGTLDARSTEQLSQHMNTPFAATTFFTAAAIFVAVRSVDKKIAASVNAKKIFGTLAGTVFGVYLLHPLAILFLENIGLKTSLCTPILSIPLLTVCTAALSFSVAALLRKVPVLRKLIQ
ncbi:MAG: acyltransferase family protein [Lachnospiraceae bacterium]|nr:acyltransferase family protein [Lachnospiraceae bacterium]